MSFHQGTSEDHLLQRLAYYCKDWHTGTSNWTNCEQRQTDIVTTEYVEHTEYTEYTEDTGNKDTGNTWHWQYMTLAIQLLSALHHR